MTSGLYLRKQPSDGCQTSDQLIGLARATSDHVFNATIWDVLVDPAYQVCASWHTAVDPVAKALAGNMHKECFQTTALPYNLPAGTRARQSFSRADGPYAAAAGHHKYQLVC